MKPVRLKHAITNVDGETFSPGIYYVSSNVSVNGGRETRILLTDIERKYQCTVKPKDLAPVFLNEIARELERIS